MDGDEGSRGRVGKGDEKEKVQLPFQLFRLGLKGRGVFWKSGFGSERELGILLNS